MAFSSIRTKMLEAFRRRALFFMGSAGFVFLIIILQLVNLQLIKGKQFEEKARLNMESYLPIEAARGNIYDRNFAPDGNNRPIVTNRPSFNLSTIPAAFHDSELMQKTIIQVSRILEIDPAPVLKDMTSGNPWERITIKEDVPFEHIVLIASHKEKFPNIEWVDSSVRVYNYGSIFSHSIGYIGSISREEFQALRQHGYRFYQNIGKSGIERQYDMDIRGTDGHIIRIVDVRNRIEGERIGQHPESGNNLVLTLDTEVQKTVYEAIGDRKGAAIVLKPSTGEVISLVSRPSFDPNMMITREDRFAISDILENKDKPFLNRVIQSRYPPASTFKLVTTIAALETDRGSPTETHHCPGKYTLKGYIDRDFHCHERHGIIDMIEAIAESCSVYYYKLGYKTGPTRILRYAGYLGLNELTGIDIPGERPGFLPSQAWKQRTFGEPWYDGDTINISIGQGFLASTPISLVNMISAIVNNGIVYKPRLLQEVRSPDNSRILRRAESEILREIPLSPTTLETIKTGMRASVESGTSRRLSYLKVPVAGKTGTAQTRSQRKVDRSQHAWFVGYAPYGAPPEETVAIAVLIEYGVAGAAAAVPVAERVFYKMQQLGYFD